MMQRSSLCFESILSVCACEKSFVRGVELIKNHSEIKKKFDETGECIRDLRDVAEALTCCRGTRLECLLKKRHQASTS